jgi:hypothetical protein
MEKDELLMYGKGHFSKNRYVTRILTCTKIRMNTRFLLPAVVAIGSIMAGAISGHSQNIPSYVPANGLLGWWPFSGNVLDQSGNGNYGIVYGASLAEDRNGEANSCYSFNGNGNYIDLPGSFYPVGSDHTISMWFLLADSTDITNTLFNTYPHRYESMGYNTYFLNQPYGFTYCIGDGINWNPCGVQASFYPVFDKSEWSHIAFVKSGQTWNFYLNGMLVHSYTENNVFSPFGTSLYLGAITCCSGEFFYGRLDDIGIWNRALSPEELSDVFLAPPPVAGCMDVSACNFNADAEVSDGNCSYPEAYFDCLGNCLDDDDGNGVCDELEIPGCMYAAALNYNPGATRDDGSCLYACQGDVNSDGQIDTADLLVLLTVYGSSCN